MKKLLLVLVVVLSFLGCRKDKVSQEAAEKIGLVFSVGGLGDKSFNDSAYEGVKRVKEKQGIDIKYVEPESVAVMKDYLQSFADEGYDLVITVGFYFVDPLTEVATNYPDTKFVIIDGVVDLPNVKSVVFDEYQRGILAGASAALKSENGVTGIVGGLEIPIITTYIDGYRAGAKMVNNDIEVLVNYAGSFSDPVKGKEIAVMMNQGGADVISHVAGGTGVGVMEAAKEKNFYAIGVDSDQKYLAPEQVVTSVLKNIDNVVEGVVEEYTAGNFKGGVETLGLKEKGIALTEKVEGIEEIEAIIEGKVQ